MGQSKFFEESGEQSVVKTAIVTKYFSAWAKVIIPSAKKKSNRIAYLDLFCGPGRYDDGTLSTPLIILKKAIEDKDLRNMLVTFFNDANPKFTQTLRESINAISSIETLRYTPKVSNQTVGDQISDQLRQARLIPSFSLIDPWGYKGVSLQLIGSLIKDWGCDCIVFFNYNRINMGLNNPIVKEHMDDLFGERRADELRKILAPMSKSDREMTIVEAIAQAIKDMGGNYILPFCFKNARGNRTSHHLIFVSKHFLGYEIMKGIMAKESSNAEQGVPSFEYNPASKYQPLLFELARPLDDLANMLLNNFAGRRMKMSEVYEHHNVGRSFIKSNYKDVLVKLELDGKITTNPKSELRPKRLGKPTFADEVMITFPPKGKI